jgi:hypothetical protein
MLTVAPYQKRRIRRISARISDAAHHLTHARGQTLDPAPHTPYNKTYLIYEDWFLEWVKSLYLPDSIE